MNSHLAQTFIHALLAGLCLGLAFLTPGGLLAVVLGWFCAINFILALKAQINSARSKHFTTLAIFLAGALSHAIAFSWMPSTISDFGGFNSIATSAIFTIFLLTASLQFVCFAWLYRALPAVLANYGLKASLSWCSVEFLFPRIFPWQLAHTQLGFPHLVQISDISGSILVSFLIIGVSECLITRKRSSIYMLLLFAASLIYGQIKILDPLLTAKPELPVSVIQANVSISEKHNQKFFEQNAERYLNLSKHVADDSKLIIWPETVITNWISDSVRNLSEDRRLPDLGKNILLGALTYKDEESVFNSAIGIKRSGEVSPPYHKQILMPFGEYVPFSNIFPWLKEIAHLPGEFSAGKHVSVFDFGSNLKAAPLICYEDLVPSLSLKAAQAGATVLVNITNDAWFGNSAALHQHHSMASFRAIETRRYLVRSTNTGFTAVVNPLGQTIASLEPYSEGILEAAIKPLELSTLYASTLRDSLWWMISIICILITSYSRFSSQRSRL